jgi:hypothetical protein
MVVVSLLCLWGSIESFDLESANRQQSSVVSTQIMRFEPVLSVVPAGAELGYLTDVPARGAGLALFLTAQYALAPRLLERSPAHEWVLGDFRRAADFAEVGQLHGLHLQQDFGNGVVLFRKEH